MLTVDLYNKFHRKGKKKFSWNFVKNEREKKTKKKENYCNIKNKKKKERNTKRITPHNFYISYANQN